MSKGNPSKKQHRSMRGKQVDMDLLRKRNELTPAVGNAKVNARGDELGPGGQIIKKREEVLGQYYKNWNCTRINWENKCSSRRCSSCRSSRSSSC